MIKRKDIYGVNPIIAMPFNSNGSVDFDSFRSLVQHLISIGCHGVTLFGIASEFYKINETEKDRLLDILIEETDDCSLYSCVSVTEHSTELAMNVATKYQQKGVNSLMLLPPHFLKPSNKKIIQHVRSVLNVVDIPVLVQYAPAETGVPISPETMAEIGNEFNHAAFKIECNPPMEYTSELLELKPNGVVMNGYAGLYMLKMLSIGGSGVMPGCSFAEIYIEIYRLWNNGETNEAIALHKKLFTYISKWMSHCEYIIEVEKVILMKRGIIATAYCRKPDYGLSGLDYVEIDAFLDDFKDLLG